ncbi:MAG: PCRF domain-containing protein [Candidatus Omnitrophica bacterium]|nr:PCRF domain-containing protein [Candidatus Omnitrophota bacterium]
MERANNRDSRNAIIEIRAGVGGEEAALFGKDLFRMYAKYSEKRGHKLEIFNTSFSAKGGFKEIVFLVKGMGAYRQFKYEAGIHRVQRIPKTESSGRIHTSAATVAVFPEVEEREFKIDSKDIRIDTFCSSGHGGQSVNTAYSAVRITHLPSGIVVSCQNERSQLQNKHRALVVLRTRLQAKREEEERAKVSQERKYQIGKGDRSEKIRTYNFPQNRVTDHRISLSLHKLDRILAGDLEPLVQTLRKKLSKEVIKV